MNRLCVRPFTALAVLGTLVAALTLAGCGRKGPLDPPPSAAAPVQPEAPTSGGLLSPMGPAAASGTRSDDHRAGVTSDGQAVAPRGQNKRIPLDALLD
ncbi:MAG: lipoprotein [Pseudolabrys sp.]